MNDTTSLLTTNLTDLWNKDQNSWTLSEDNNNTIQKDLIKNIWDWLYPNKFPKMAAVNIDHGSYQINMLKLQLQQIQNQIGQLKILLQTLQ